MAKSDFVGEAFTYVHQKDADFAFIFELNGVILKQTGRTTITSTTQTVTLSLTEILPIFQNYNNINWNYSFNSALNRSTLVASDPTNLQRTVVLNIKKRGAWSDTLVCNNTGTSSGTAITCDLGSVKDNLYLVNAYLYVTGGEHLLYSNLDNYWPTTPTFALTGILASGVIILFAGLAGASSPLTLVAFTIGAAIFTIAIGWLPIEIGVVMGLAILGFIVIIA